MDVQYRPSFKLKLNDTEKGLLLKIAFDPNPLSPYNLAKISKKPYSNVHRILKKMEQLDLIKMISEQSEKMGIKTLYSPTLLGYCFSICILCEGKQALKPDESTIKIINNASTVHPFFRQATKWIRIFNEKGVKKGKIAITLLISGILESYYILLDQHEKKLLSNDKLEEEWITYLFKSISEPMLHFDCDELFFKEIYPYFRNSIYWGIIEADIIRQKIYLEDRLIFIDKLMNFSKE
jgi:hypothetical protein